MMYEFKNIHEIFRARFGTHASAENPWSNTENGPMWHNHTHRLVLLNVPCPYAAGSWLVTPYSGRWPTKDEYENRFLTIPNWEWAT